MNRKGDAGDNLALIMFLLILVILGSSIVIGVRSFFGEGYDFRFAEASQLEDRILTCLEQHDFFVEGFDVYTACNLNKQVFEESLLSIYIKKTAHGEVFSVGIADYVNQCNFIGGRENLAYPRCVQGTTVQRGEELTYVIGSNHKSRRVLL